MKHDWLGKRHQILSYAQCGNPLKRPVIMVYSKKGKKFVLDGNHTLLALLALKKRCKILVFESKT